MEGVGDLLYGDEKEINKSVFSKKVNGLWNKANQMQQVTQNNGLCFSLIHKIHYI
jgi:hypothetical protein